jgi:hypothetical protein
MSPVYQGLACPSKAAIILSRRFPAVPDDELMQVPARQRSLVDIAAEILAAETNDFAATYAGFCLTSLPHRDPGVRTWERKNRPVQPAC